MPFFSRPGPGEEGTDASATAEHQKWIPVRARRNSMIVSMSPRTHSFIAYYSFTLNPNPPEPPKSYMLPNTLPHYRNMKAFSGWAKVLRNFDMSSADSLAHASGADFQAFSFKRVHMRHNLNY